MSSKAFGPDPRTPDGEMEAFYGDLTDKHMDALWRILGNLPKSNIDEAQYDPCHWRWSDLQPFILRAGDLVAPGPGAERRVISMINPSLGPVHSASHTLSANVQMVLPGEKAPSHRHHIAAIRFIMEGEAVVTIVEGEPVVMRPGDLVLTPAWHWHGHVNKSDGPMLWMDSLDGPLVRHLGQQYQEPYPSDLQAATTTEGHSLALYGAGHLRPLGTKNPSPVSPLFSYPWAETQAALYELAKFEADPFDDVAFDYTNPTTGGHVLPTIGCRIQMLRKTVRTRAHRHTYSSIYHVYRGQGSTVVDGVRIDWQQGDFFVLPPNCWHEHVNMSDEDAFLFSTNDAPVLEALQLSRTQAFPDNDGRQNVVASYAERYGYEVEKARQ